MSQNELVTILSGIAGLLLSVATSYYPPFSAWYYGKIDAKFRGLVQIGLDVVAAGLIFGLSCIALFDWVTCDKKSVYDLVRACGAAIISGITAYTALPKSPTKTALELAKNTENTLDKTTPVQ